LPFAELGDLRVYYERAGSGAPLLAISGTGGDLRQMQPVAERLLAKHFDVVWYDQRGLGQTSKPDRPYTMADYADDAAALISYVGWRDALIFAVSFGGMVAQELVLRHPAMVRRLVLACASPGGAGGASYPLHELPPMTPRELAQRLVPILDTRQDAAWAAANPDAYTALINLIGGAPLGAEEPGHAMGARRQLEARAEHDAWDRLAQIKCPVLIAAGKYDGQAPPDRQHAMASRITQAELRFFDGGHLFLFQDAAAFPAIVEFLGR